MEKQVVFVLGVGRSGTSALARVLSLSGGALPARLWPAHESNPEGHWEPVEAIEINNAFLHAHDSTWFDPSLRLQGEAEIGCGATEALVARIGAFLESWSGAFLVVKEPRIAAMAEVWFAAARRCGIVAKVVIPVRHPAEVGASLMRRDGMSRELAAMLWLKYALLAERSSRAVPRVFVSYPALLADWRGQVVRIAAALALPAAPVDAPAIDAFLRPDLYHQRHTGAAAWDAGPLPLAEVYATLLAATTGAAPDTATLDRAFDHSRAWERTVRGAWAEFREKFGPVAETRHYEAIDIARAELAKAEGEKAGLVADNAALRQEAERLRRAIAEIHGSTSWRVTAPVRAMRQRLGHRG